MSPVAMICGVTSASSTSRWAPTGTSRQQLWRIQTSQGPLTAGVLIAATGALADPALPALPGNRLVHREGVSLRALGPRSRPDAAGGSPWSAPAPRRSSSSPRSSPRSVTWRCSSARRRGSCPARTRASPRPCGRALPAIRALLRLRAQERVLAAGELSSRLPASRGDARRRATGPRPHRPPGRRPGPAGQAHPGLPARVQARAGLKPLVPGSVRAQCRRDHQWDTRGDRGRHRRHRGRCAPRGHDHLRHRLSGHRPADQPSRPRSRRPNPGRALAGQPAGPPRPGGDRLSEPVPAAWGPTPDLATTRCC